MKFTKIIFTVAFALLWITPSFSSNRSGSLQELMVKSGMEKQLEGMVDVTFSSLDQGHQNIPPEARTKIKQSFKEAYDVPALRQAVTKSLDENLTDNDIKGSLEWLNSPLGQEITQLEEKASTPEGAKESALFLRQTTEIPETRRELIQRLDRAIHGTEMAVEMYMNSAIATATAAHAALDDPKKPSLDKVVKDTESARPKIEPQMEQYVLGSFLYTYQSLSDEDLEKYIKFFESEIGTRYSTFSIKALTDAFQLSAKKFGKDIGHLINEKIQKEQSSDLPLASEPANSSN